MEFRVLLGVWELKLWVSAATGIDDTWLAQQVAMRTLQRFAREQLCQMLRVYIRSQQCGRTMRWSLVCSTIAIASSG